MRRIHASKFKAKCLALVDEVARTGETIVVTKKGKPVAELRGPSLIGLHKGRVKIRGDIVSPLARLSLLERHGIIRRGAGKRANLILKKPPPKIAKGASLLRALLADREEGR